MPKTTKSARPASKALKAPRATGTVPKAVKKVVEAVSKADRMTTLARKEWPKDILSPTNDFVFKSLFGVQGRLRTTVGLLQAFLGLHDEEIKTVQVVDPALNRRFKGDKLSTLDLRVVTSLRDINVEMQNLKEPELFDRILFYLAKRVASQVVSGEDYRRMPQTVSIVFMNVNIWDDGQYYHCFEMTDHKTELVYPNSPLIIVVELKKMPAKDDGTLMWPWMKFLTAKTPEEYAALRERGEAMAESVARLMEVSADEKARMRADSRDKFLWQQAALRRAGLAEGEAKGRAEGEAKGLAKGLAKGMAKGLAKGMEKVARRMLRDNMAPARIAELTDLPLAEIKRLAAE